VTVYLFIKLILHNDVRKKKLQNIHQKTLRKADLSYVVVKTVPLCGNSFQRQNTNDMYCTIFCCHFAAVGKVDLARGFGWLRVVSGALGSYFRLKQIVIYYGVIWNSNNNGYY
jgi:hypothetical protein